jgi:predicted dehydrogenase
MVAEKLKVGVIGTGIFGERHLQTYSTYGRAELVAVCDLDEPRARLMTEKYGARRFYRDYHDLLADEVEAVSVATPDHLHREVAVACARAGKHILLEKPLATTVEDAEAIRDAVRASGVTLMVDFHNRVNPPFLSVKAALEAGELGEPSFVYARLSNTTKVPLSMLKWAGNSSALWFLGSHTVDLVRWLLNDNPVSVSALSTSGVLKAHGLGCDDVHAALVKFAKGTVAVFENAWILPATQPTVKDFTFELLGSKGAMYVDAAQNRLVQKYTDGTAAFPDLLAVTPSRREPLGFVYESIRHFVDRVLDGGEPLATVDDGVWNTKILCAIEKSCALGEPVGL